MNVPKRAVYKRVAADNRPGQVWDAIAINCDQYHEIKLIGGVVFGFQRGRLIDVTEDCGVTWTRWASLPVPLGGYAVLPKVENGRQLVYIVGGGVDYKTFSRTIYVSRDFLKTFEVVAELCEWPRGYLPLNCHGVVCPNGDFLVYQRFSVSSPRWISTDRGRSWQLIPPDGVNIRPRSMVTFQDKVYGISDKQVVFSINSGRDWIQVGHNLSPHILIKAEEPDRLICFGAHRTYELLPGEDSWTLYGDNGEVVWSKLVCYYNEISSLPQGSHDGNCLLGFSNAENAIVLYVISSNPYKLRFGIVSKPQNNE